MLVAGNGQNVNVVVAADRTGYRRERKGIFSFLFFSFLGVVVVSLKSDPQSQSVTSIIQDPKHP